MATNQKYQFIYNGVEYDATDYVKNHPGGIEFIQNMKN
jgi:cytochrome b involved in lipid metabolism